MAEREIIASFLEEDASLFTPHSERRKQLEDYINTLLVNDFQKLVFILYRVDVSEAKLKLLLHQNPTVDAAALITDLLIDRQLEKQKTKGAFKAPPDIPEDEKW